MQHGVDTRNPQMTRSTAGAIPPRRRCIVVVDDEPDALFLLTLVFRRAGYEVIPASNGQEALAEIERGAPDAIVTDLRMPLMDGTELIAAVRARAATTATPVILVSAYPAAGTGADAIVPKPFSPDHLVSVVQRLCREHD